MPRLRRARAVRVDPESEGPEGLGPERPLRHVSGNRAGARVLGERPKYQMTNDQIPMVPRSIKSPHPPFVKGGRRGDFVGPTA